MVLTRHLDYYCTDDGAKLLETYPDFINNIWLNDNNREWWFKKDNKIFTKINNLYVEKTGTDYKELLQYKEMDKLLHSNQYKHIRVAKTFFGTSDKILLEYCKFRYNMQQSTNSVHANAAAIEELWNLGMMGIPMDLCVEPNGDLIILDPHIPILDRE